MNKMNSTNNLQGNSGSDASLFDENDAIFDFTMPEGADPELQKRLQLMTETRKKEREATNKLLKDASARGKTTAQAKGSNNGGVKLNKKG